MLHRSWMIWSFSRSSFSAVWVIEKLWNGIYVFPWHSGKSMAQYKTYYGEAQLRAHECKAWMQDWKDEQHVETAEHKSGFPDISLPWVWVCLKWLEWTCANFPMERIFTVSPTWGCQSLFLPLWLFPKILEVSPRCSKALALKLSSWSWAAFNSILPRVKASKICFTCLWLVETKSGAGDFCVCKCLKDV